MNDVKIDGEALNTWIKSTGETRAAIAAQLGRSKTYFYDVTRKGSMKKVAYDLMVKTFDLPEGSFIPKEKPAPKEEPKNATALCSDTIGYHLTLNVYKNKLRMGLCFQQKEIVYAWSKIKGDTEMDLIQSISYAAHMFYKYAEQKDLSGENCSNA